MDRLAVELQLIVLKLLGGSVEDMVALFQAYPLCGTQVYECFQNSLREQPSGEAQAAFKSEAAVDFVREGLDGGLMG
jgi:hypothetical protein